MNKLLREYAKLIVRKGVNVAEGQVVLVKAPVEVYDFARIVVEEAYRAGASKVYVDYNDVMNNRNDYVYQNIDSLKEVEDFEVSKAKYLVDNNFCAISLVSPNVEALTGIDAVKLQARSQARGTKLDFFSKYTMNNDGQWVVAAVSSKNWALKVFPNDSNAEEKLWSAIFKACHVDEFDSVENWTKHSEKISEHAKLLNDYDFLKLHFKNSLGTDLEVYLADDNIFCGGDDYSTKGVRFSPNIPTEEVFGAPYKTKVNGKVVATKPLNYQGSIIDGFSLTFKNGKVIDYKAKVGEDNLKSLIEFDEGSCYLGEVALISHDSPISNMNILFYNTLYDENASCHLALGASYPTNIKNGTNLTREELNQKGANDSRTHVDFMFGSSDMYIVGTTRSGEEVVLFKDGNFII